ncbi:MAG: hypothetical protein ACE5IW_08975, partial [bacterium]
HEHRDVMLWMSGILLATVFAVLIVRPLREGNFRRLVIVPLLVVSGLLIYGADKGGRLVFEYGMGVKAPAEMTEQETSAHTHAESSEKEVPESHSAMPDSSRQKKHIHADGKEHVH